MSHIQRPLTLPKHPELLHEINEMMIAIKLHHISFKSPEVIKALSSNRQPTWEEILETLGASYKAINEQREDPRKY